MFILLLIIILLIMLLRYISVDITIHQKLVLTFFIKYSSYEYFKLNMHINSQN